MSLLRRIKWIAIIGIAVVLVTAGVLYLLASGIPSRYRPAHLSPEQRRRWANEFVNHVLAFGNDAQDNKPYTWSVTEEKLNDYLASIDEIAANAPGRSSGQVHKIMEKIGLASPAIALGDGVLTAMVRTTTYNKVLSVDVRFTFPSERQVSVRMAAVRVGHLPIPKGLVRDVVSKLKSRLAGGSEGDLGGSSSSGSLAERAGRVLARVIRAIDEEPIDNELLWPIGKKHVRITGVEIVAGALTLHVTPTRRGAMDR